MSITVRFDWAEMYVSNSTIISLQLLTPPNSIKPDEWPGGISGGGVKIFEKFFISYSKSPCFPEQFKGSHGYPTRCLHHNSKMGLKNRIPHDFPNSIKPDECRSRAHSAWWNPHLGNYLSISELYIYVQSNEHNCAVRLSINVRFKIRPLFPSNYWLPPIPSSRTSGWGISGGRGNFLGGKFFEKKFISYSKSPCFREQFKGSHGYPTHCLHNKSKMGLKSRVPHDSPKSI